MKPLGIAIAGSGMVAGVHASAIQEIQEAKLIGVWSYFAEEIQTFSDRYHTRGYQT